MMGNYEKNLEVGDIVECSECKDEFVLQRYMIWVNDESCLCQDCVDEWEEQIDKEIFCTYAPTFIKF